MYGFISNDQNKVNHVYPESNSICICIDCLFSNPILFCDFRAICEYEFQRHDDQDKIYKFCSPKVLRLLEVLKQFRPPQPEVEDAGTPTEGSAPKSKAIEGTSTQTQGLNSSNAADLPTSAGTPSDEKPAPPEETGEQEGAKPLEETKPPEEAKLKSEPKEESPEVNVVPKQPVRGMCNSEK